MGTTGRYRESFVRVSPGLMWEDYESSASAAFGASFGLGYDTQGVTQWLLRGHMGESEYGINNLVRSFTGNESPYVDTAEANQLGEEYGLKFNRPIRQNSLQIKIDNKRRELERQSILNRAPKTWGTTGATLSAGLLASIADPIELAVSMVPILGEARAARIATKYGTGKGRLITGGIEGAVGGGALEPVRLLLTEQEQTDYSMYDSLANISFGGVMGSGFRYIGGRLSDRLNRGADIEDLKVNAITQSGQKLYIPERLGMTSAETRLAATRAALSDVLEGRPIDVEDILMTDKGFSGKIETFRKIAVNDQRAPFLNAENERRLAARFKEDIAVALDEKFESRTQADEYIRTQAKSNDISRSNYFVEKTEDGFEVLKAHYAAVDVDDVGAPVKFDKGTKRQQKRGADQYAKKKNAEKAPDDLSEYHSIELKDGYTVVKGRGLTEADLEKIKKSPLFLAPDTMEELSTTTIPTDILKNFAAKKQAQTTGHFLRNISQTPEPKKVTPKQEFDEIVTQAEASPYNFETMIENLPDNIDRSKFMADLEEVKLADADYAEFEKMKENIMALADCMGG